MASHAQVAAGFGPKDAIKKVGRGKTLSQDLNADEARQAFKALLDGQFTPVQFGAFLQALRIKELTQDELNALFAEVIGRVVVGQVNASIAASGVIDRPTAPDMALVLNLASDTARKGGLLSLLAARVLSQALAPRNAAVGVLRSDPVMTRNETSYAQTWALWSPVAQAPKVQSQEAPSLEANWVETSVAECIPGWNRFDALRHELGFRSCLHTVEKLVNPWPQAPLILGISHKQYAERMAETLRANGRTGFIVLGNHGTADLVLHKPTEVVQVTKDAVVDLMVDPSMAGLKPDSSLYSLGAFKEWQVWLQTTLPAGFNDALVLQTAFMAFCSGIFESVEKALPDASAWVGTWVAAVREGKG